MFTGNNNRSPQCAQNGMHRGLLSGSKNKTLEGVPFYQMQRTLSTAGTTHGLITASPQFHLAHHSNFIQQTFRTKQNDSELKSQYTFEAFAPQAPKGITALHSFYTDVPAAKKHPTVEQPMPHFLDGIKQLFKGIINGDQYCNTSSSEKNTQSLANTEINIKDDSKNHSSCYNTPILASSTLVSTIEVKPGNANVEITKLLTSEVFTAPQAEPSKHTKISSSEPDTVKTTPVEIPKNESAKSTVNVAVTPPMQISKPTCCFFEIEFKSEPAINVKRKKCFNLYPALTASKSNSKSPPSKATVSGKTTMIFCDSDEESDDDDCVCLVQKTPNIDVTICGISATSDKSVFRPSRQRQISECSDDSFVVCFMDDDAQIIDSEEQQIDAEDSDTDTSDDCDSVDEYTTDSDDVDDYNYNLPKSATKSLDVVDASFTLLKNRVDLKTDPSLLLEPANCNETPKHPVGKVKTENQTDSGFDEDRKVRFNLQTEVHVIRAWNYAYRAARKGPWEQIGRDRGRFQKRIENAASYLNPILTSEHREKIYCSRFCEKDC